MDMYSKFESLLEKYNTTAYKVGKATNITSSTFSNWKNGISMTPIRMKQARPGSCSQ